MADEKAPVLPLAVVRPAKLDAEDGRRHDATKSEADARDEQDRGNIWQQLVLPVVLTLVLLAAALSLPVLLVLPKAFTLAGTLSLEVGGGHHSGGVSRRELREILLSTPSNDSAAEWLRYYTSGPHLAGQNYSQAAWTRDRWAEWGAAAHITAYDLYLNTPVDHGLSLLKAAPAPDGTGATGATDWVVDFEASLEEDVLADDPTTGLADRVPTFHGYSASGNVTGPLVYVNYGTYQDYADLERANVSLRGAVALARYGGIFRGLKVKRAQELGAVGVLLYSDPGDDGETTEANGFAAYPEGPARQPSSVQRGSVQYISSLPGDPTTPGYPSKPGVPRVSPNGSTPQIPSLPLSYADAVPLLRALNGHGPSSRDLGPWWTRREGLGGHGVRYHVGPTPADAVQVHLRSEQAYTTTPIWNVLGVFNGSVLPHEVVVLGNHRDAWIAGGAVDPNSGSAVVNEVVRALGAAAARGWRPLRTIVVASWDGEEYGLLGSTEWVEEYLPWLQHATVAYVNIDTGVSGPRFSASGVPLVHDLLRAVAGEVASPNQTVPGQTVGDLWSGRIGSLGSGSDFTAFLDHAGIASLDLGFTGGLDSADGSAHGGHPVYHYHSNYDSYHWMATYGDPGFVYHRTMAQLLGLLVAHLATDFVVPFRAADYARALAEYVDKIRAQLEAHGTAEEATVADDVALVASDDDMAVRRGRQLGPEGPEGPGLAGGQHACHDAKPRVYKALDRLDAAVAELATHAAALDAKADVLRDKVDKKTGGLADDEDEDEDDGGILLLLAAPRWWRRLVRRVKRVWLAAQVLVVNKQYQQLERRFLYAPGLDGRPWFKHVVYAPGVWTGYAGAVFPGLVESIDAGNWTNAVRWASIVEDRVRGAVRLLHL